MSSPLKGKKRPPFSDEWRLNMSLAHKGEKKPPRSKEYRANLSKSKLGKNNPMFGRKITEEHRRKLSESHKGENAYNWQGGKETEKTRKLISENQRRAIKRNNGGKFTTMEWAMLKWIYNFTCPCCLKKEPEIKLTIDHIKPISLGGDNNLPNIQPLCLACNSGKKNRNSICFDFPQRLLEDMKNK